MKYPDNIHHLMKSFCIVGKAAELSGDVNHLVIMLLLVLSTSVSYLDSLVTKSKL